MGVFFGVERGGGEPPLLSLSLLEFQGETKFQTLLPKI